MNAGLKAYVQAAIALLFAVLFAGLAWRGTIQPETVVSVVAGVLAAYFGIEALFRTIRR